MREKTKLHRLHFIPCCKFRKIIVMARIHGLIKNKVLQVVKIYIKNVPLFVDLAFSIKKATNTSNERIFITICYKHIQTTPY